MIKRTTIIIFLILVLSGTAFGFTIRKKNNRANKFFSEEKYRKAFSLYEELDKMVAKKKEKLKSIIKYNKGNALHKLGKFEESMDSYKQSLSLLKDMEKLSDINYNMGNVSYRRGRLEDALKYYMKTLDIDPDDKDAKFNIELIKKKMEEQKKKNKDKKDEDKKEKENGKENNKDKKSKDKNKEKEKEKDERDKKEKQDQKKKQEHKPKKEKISRENALRILKALEQKEREIREKEKAKVEKRAGLGKDW